MKQTNNEFFEKNIKIYTYNNRNTQSKCPLFNQKMKRQNKNTIISTNKSELMRKTRPSFLERNKIQLTSCRC